MSDSDSVPASLDSQAQPVIAPDHQIDAASTSLPMPAESAVSEPSANAPSAASDGLPDWEPLTPELVEDEAIRGDAMLRWAVVFLGVLLGCQQIVETTTLVHVKTGQYLRTHGWLPPVHDVFSSTASEHRWVNLSWLWDIISSFLFALGHGAGLSLVPAIGVATLGSLLGRIGRPGAPTWWGSVLGILALLAGYLQFSGQSELLTLLGVAVVLWRIHLWRNSNATLWVLPLLFAMWSNLDPRLYLGLAVMLLVGLGEVLGSVLGRAEFSGSQRRSYWIVLLMCVLASLLNPFGWESLVSPFRLYATEYPSLMSYASTPPNWEDVGYFGVFSFDVWQPLRLPMVAGAIVVVAATATLILNRRQLQGSDILLLAGFVGFAALASGDLAVAALVACVVGTLNGQAWYQANCRQTYSIEWRELLFSRGGRALTVLAFFLLAVMAVNHSLFGVGDKRIGLGLSHELDSMIASYQKAVEGSLDERPFNFSPRQGDVLIWVDQKPFVDSRAGLFASGPTNVWELHDRTRRSLVVSGVKETTAASDAVFTNSPLIWKVVFDDYRLTHAMPRLVGVLPTAYLNMLGSPVWKLTHLGAHCAILYRLDLKSEELNDYIESHVVDFAKQTREELPMAPMRPDFSRSPTWFQKYVAAPTPRIDNSVHEADNLMIHIRNMLDGKMRMEDVQAGAIALQAIRKANAGLADFTDQALAFEVLGEAYSFLATLESNMAREGGRELINSFRFQQAAGAFHQALRLAPNSIRTRSQFMQLLEKHNRIDLALREVYELDRLLEDLDESDERTMQLLGRQLLLREKWLSQVEEMQGKIQKVLETGEPPIQIALQVYQAGFTLEALKLVEGDPLRVKESPQAQAFQSQLRFEAGRLEEAYNFFELETDQSSSAWRLPASWTKLGRGEYDQAIDLWKRELQSGQQQTLLGLLSTIPLCQSPFHMAPQANVWPVQHGLSVTDAEFRWLEEESALLWYTAMAQLESGRSHLAAKTLAGVLEANPETFLRPVIRFYLYLLTEDLVDLEPPSEWIPITSDLFAPEEEK